MGERKSSSIANQSSGLGKKPLKTGGSKWLMWLEAMMRAPRRGTGEIRMTLTRAVRRKRIRHPVITTR
jgi:hypothetical protein